MLGRQRGRPVRIQVSYQVAFKTTVSGFGPVRGLVVRLAWLLQWPDAALTHGRNQAPCRAPGMGVCLNATWYHEGRNGSGGARKAFSGG
ncbi:hypothetical protein JCM30394_22820 [Deferrisoma palaeochoriense]